MGLPASGATGWDGGVQRLGRGNGGSSHPGSEGWDWLGWACGLPWQLQELEELKASTAEQLAESATWRFWLNWKPMKNTFFGTVKGVCERQVVPIVCLAALGILHAKMVIRCSEGSGPHLKHLPPRVRKTGGKSWSSTLRLDLKETHGAELGTPERDGSNHDQHRSGGSSIFAHMTNFFGKPARKTQHFEEMYNSSICGFAESVRIGD